MKIKLLFCAVLTLCTTHTQFGMENIAINTEVIKHDIAIIRSFYSGLFYGMANIDQQEIMPSTIFARPSSPRNHLPGLKGNNVDFYLNKLGITNPECLQKLDEKFLHEYEKTKSSSKAWNNFNEYFAQEIIQKPFDAWLKELNN